MKKYSCEKHVLRKFMAVLFKLAINWNHTSLHQIEWATRVAYTYKIMLLLCYKLNGLAHVTWNNTGISENVIQCKSKDKQILHDVWFWGTVSMFISNVDAEEHFSLMVMRSGRKEISLVTIFCIIDWFAQVNALVRTHHMAYLRFMGFNICDFFYLKQKES